MTVETVRTFHPTTNRYRFDFDECHFQRGWAQIDTSQDASYFGQWAHPTQRRIVAFVEGDIIITRCSTDEEFAAEVRKIETFHREDGSWKGIDGMCRPEIIEQFTAIGLADLLH